MQSRTNYSNIPPSIESKLGKNLHNKPNHPVEIMKRHIIQYFKSLKYNFEFYDNLEPVVTVENNFDKLLIPIDHPTRSKSDTYYVSETMVLRTHTSAHQNELLAKGINNFVVVGDVYRRDEIDRCHYPVFHQLEFVAKVENNLHPSEELLCLLNGLVEYLFPNCKYRVNPDYFPFTHPSYEYEVEYMGNYMEILGCGVVHPTIIEQNNLQGTYVAGGLGLDRLCCVLFGIPDIRYLWSNHPRFIDQFASGDINTKFQLYSELPVMTKDISFWIPNNKLMDDKWLDENDFFELIRENCGDWAGEVRLLDQFSHPSKGKSRMYRIVFNPIDPNLNNSAHFTSKCNSLLCDLRKMIMEKKLDVELR